MSTYELAATTGLSKSTVGRWVRGETDLSVSNFEAIADALGLTSKQHGGKRTAGPGKSLGAPPKRGVAKVPFSGRATPEVVEFLRQTGNISEQIETVVRRSKAFREWNQAR